MTYHRETLEMLAEMEQLGMGRWMNLPPAMYRQAGLAWSLFRQGRLEEAREEAGAVLGVLRGMAVAA